MKISIIGRPAQEKFFDAQFAGEVWGINAHRPAWVPQWHRMFNLHRYEHLERDWAHGIPIEKEWALAYPKVPFYTVDQWPGKSLPGWVKFPREDLSRQPRSDYHASSADWMVAFAIYIGVTEIELHGISLMGDISEPMSARACMEYWCGYAEGNGVKVTCAPDCNLFMQYHVVKSRSVYGYDDIRLVEERDQSPCD